MAFLGIVFFWKSSIPMSNAGVASSTVSISRLHFRYKFVYILLGSVSKIGSDKRNGERSSMEPVPSISFSRHVLELRYVGISEGSSESTVISQTRGQIQSMGDCRVELQSIA
uniref:Uncharacterized protein n=1 Tax=Glossina palpalis gambiensis TaxID=67801 RepID=A0A1B0C070_9MUSC